MKDVATTYVLRAENASKYVCGRGSTLDPAGGAPSSIWGRRRKGSGRERREGEQEGGRGKFGRPSKNPGYALPKGD